MTFATGRSHPDGAGLQRAAHSVGSVQVLCHHSSGQAILCVVRSLNHLQAGTSGEGHAGQTCIQNLELSYLDRQLLGAPCMSWSLQDVELQALIYNGT